MGLYDRDYYRSNARSSGIRRIFSTAVGTLLVINLGVWLVQVATSSPEVESSGATVLLSCSAEQIFSGFPQLWRLVTAGFSHSTHTLLHLGGNMFFLFIFGREVERIYGKRDFFILYIASGVVAIFCEVLYHQLFGDAIDRFRPVLGASGSILALVVLLTTFYPHRTIQLLFLPFVQFPLWVLCALFILLDLFGTFSGSSDVANVAHLAGAGFGFLYRYYDLRWERVRTWPRRRGSRRRSRKARVSSGTGGSPGSQTSPPPRGRGGEPDRVSRRIEQILEKIGRDGIGSLSDEEREFLVENSKRYRSPS